MLTLPLIRLVFEAAHIQRWNEFIRPSGFTELDKQAHKAIIMYVLAKCQEEQGDKIDYSLLVDGFVSQYLHRTLLTDIKPPIYKKLYATHSQEINKWANEQLSKKLSNDEIVVRMNNFEEKKIGTLEDSILKAAHYLASRWEFGIIESMNQKVYGINETRKGIDLELEDHYHLMGVQKIALGQKTYDFIDLLGRLRFQKRWATTPRTPETSVMGHSVVVALLSYFSSIDANACSKRQTNNFFAGLFHDLPEVLTRDIITPVKYSIEGLDTLVKKIEEELLEDQLFPLAAPSWRGELKYYIVDEFDDKVMIDGKMKKVTSDELHTQYNNDIYNGIDGKLVGICDKFAAFVEASLSIEYGTVSTHLTEAVRTQLEKNKELALHGIKYGELYKSLHDEVILKGIH